MQVVSLKALVRYSLVGTAAICLFGQPPKDTQGLPARVSPAEYQSQGKAGTVTIAADFVRHSVPTEQQTLTTEDYIVVEAALFGPADSKLQISIEDFSLRMNGNKNALRAQPYGLVFSSLKDPEWIPPESAGGGQKSKGGISGGGGGGGGQEPSSPPPVIKVPIELQRQMAQRTQKAALPIGERALPQAGLLFFQHRGKTEKIKSLELIYTGPAGTATLTLQP